MKIDSQSPEQALLGMSNGGRDSRQKFDEIAAVKSNAAAAPQGFTKRTVFFLGCACTFHDPVCVDLSDLPQGWETYPLTLSGYRVNLGWWGAFWSIFSANHNDFFLIWSDVLPLLAYLVVAFVHFGSSKFQAASSSLKALELGVFLGCIVCRSTSSFYHIFNATSLWTSQRLINVDLIGITFMSCVSPYFYVLGDYTNLASADVDLGASFWVYCSTLFFIQIVCILVFVCNLTLGESWLASVSRQPILCLLSAWGNWAGFRIAINPALSASLRAHCAISLVCLLFGYVLCFMNQWPERFLRKGVADGKCWNSHVIWHGLLAVSQVSFIMVPFVY